VQELRKFVADGVPSENVYAADLQGEFFESGCKLFNDKDRLTSKFIAADVFDPNSGLSALDGNIDIVYAAALIHLFDYNDQLLACQRIVKFVEG